MTLTCRDTPHRDTPQPRWEVWGTRYLTHYSSCLLTLTCHILSVCLLSPHWLAWASHGTLCDWRVMSVCLSVRHHPLHLPAALTGFVDPVFESRDTELALVSTRLRRLQACHSYGVTVWAECNYFARLLYSEDVFIQVNNFWSVVIDRTT